MKKFKDRLDSKYTKVALYTAGTIILTVVVLYLLYMSRPFWGMLWEITVAILKPLVIGAVLCYLIRPLVDFFNRKFQRISHHDNPMMGLSVLFSLLIVFGAVALILAIIIVSMTKQITSINYESLLALFNGVQSDAHSLAGQISAFLSNAGIDMAYIGSLITKNLPKLAGNIGSSASTLFFGIIFAVYFLIDGDRISKYWKNIAKKIFSRKTIDWLKEAGEDLDHCFAGYIRGQALDACLVGVVATVALILVGMPYAPLIGLIIGVGNLIPYLGPIMGYLAVIIVNLLDFDIKMLVIGLIIIGIIMFIDGNIINPKLLAGTIKVHPLLVVASLLAGSALGGIAGMLIAVPSGAFIKLQFEKWVNKRESIH